MGELILTDSERRLLADVTAIILERHKPTAVEYIATVYGLMPADTWASYQAMQNLPV